MIPTGWELVVIIGVLILLFGAKRLPEMARSIGQSARVFKGEMKGMKDEDKSASASTTPPTAQEPPAPPQALPPGQADTTQPPPASTARPEQSS
ncbi:Sec-independent protein translocase subunit TatA [Pseudonocardia sp.]|jgi:sec-independent protein translocase protein TatA|uniref:Sec-independent protein translocase subunit TatA n=1 Tax=Pseudonocardia sp. TaxID=60912 RepID=UPI003D0DCE24